MQSLLQGAHAQQHNTLDSDAHSLGMAKQARRGVDIMLEQAAGVLEGMGANRDTLKVMCCLVLSTIYFYRENSIT